MYNGGVDTDRIDMVLYLDMDDVVADFTGYAAEIVGYNPRELGLYKYPENDWKVLSANPRIYRDLKPIDGAIEFVEELKKLDCQIFFLTAIPSGNDVPYSFQDKLDWARTYFPGIDVFFGPYSKDKVAKAKGNILVDDRKKNIDAWRANGGKGVWLETPDYAKALEEIKQCF